MASKPLGWPASQYTLFLSSPEACHLSIGNYILWISFFRCCVTFHKYMHSLLSALCNPMFLPWYTVSIQVIAQGFGELTLLLLYFLLNSAYRNFISVLFLALRSPVSICIQPPLWPLMDRTTTETVSHDGYSELIPLFHLHFLFPLE